MVEANGDELRHKAIELRDSKKLLGAVARVQEPLLDIALQLRQRGETQLGDDVLDATKHLNQLTKVVLRVAFGSVTLDSRTGVGLVSDFIVDADDILARLKGILKRLKDDMVPVERRAEGLTIAALTDRLDTVKQMIDESGIGQAGARALEAAHRQKRR